MSHRVIRYIYVHIMSFEFQCPGGDCDHRNLVINFFSSKSDAIVMDISAAFRGISPKPPGLGDDPQLNARRL